MTFISRTTPCLPLVAALICALAALPAAAHRAWLLPSATAVDAPGAVVTVDAAISEDLFEFDSFALALDALRVSAPDGSQVATDARNEAKRRVTFDLKLPRKGTYRIAGVTDMTMASYKVDGEMKRWRGASTALAQEVPADAQDLLVTRMLGRAETFVSLDTAGLPSNSPTGQGIELQVLTAPTDLSAGDTSRFTLLLDGKPYSNADVTVIRGGNRYRYKIGEIGLKTDAAGNFSVVWPEAGRYWLGVSHGGRGGPGGPGSGSAPGGERPPGPALRETYSATFEVLPK